MGVKLPFLKYKKIFSSLEKNFFFCLFFTNYCYSTLYQLKKIGLGPNCCLFNFEKNTLLQESEMRPTGGPSHIVKNPSVDSLWDSVATKLQP